MTMRRNFRKGLRFPNGIPRAVTTDDLRHRIAYAIAQADGDAPGMEPASCDYEIADAVIRELGPLVRYWDKDFKELHYCRECGGWGPKDD